MSSSDDGCGGGASVSLDVARITAALSPQGPLARALEGFESREEQVGMAAAVARTLSGGGHLVVEAGTGVGKSLAYLVPAIHWCRASGGRVIVSTHTINLQEQLFRKDLPLLAAHLGVPFRAALVKGRRNYLCLEKAEEIRAQPSLVAADTLAPDLDALLRWSARTEDGSTSDLDFAPPPEAWNEIVADNDDCLRSRCPSYERCFFYRARREAASADVLIANHHLVLADGALRAALPDGASSGFLPDAGRLVIDEAHHLEDVATDVLGASLGRRRIESLLSRLESQRRSDRGVLPSLRERLVAIGTAGDAESAAAAVAWIEERLSPRLRALRGSTARVFDALRLALEAEIGRVEGERRNAAREDRPPEEVTVRVVPELRVSAFWGGVAALLADLAGALEAFAADTRGALDRVAELSDESGAKVLYAASQLQALGSRLDAAARDARSFLADDSLHCRWLSLRPGAEVSLHTAPIDVGEHLRRSLFERFEAVVATSATLSFQRRFDHFIERTGMGLLPSGSVDRLRVASPFRYEDQALLVVPSDLPDPGEPRYETLLDETIARLLVASRGGAFVLFTSYHALERVEAALRARLGAAGIRVWRQGEAARHVLVERFRRDGSGALFGTDSFWEGVDVRGDALRLVVIAKLPFEPPAEPIHRARVEALEATGGNAFFDYALPRAVIKLRQGFGRLIRSRADRGVVALLDSRLVRRSYAEAFLESLPPARQVIGPREQVLRAVESFFRG